MKYAKVYFTLVTVLALSCKVASPPSGKSNGTLRVGFYNVENLFDTLNDPLTNDEDFTPSGKLNWNGKKYSEKLDRIAQVISEMPNGMADVMGMCEIENRAVLEDLVKSNRLKNQDWGIVHFDSPDERGIDVALIYNAQKASLVSSNAIELKLDGGDRTRDVLHVVLRADSEDLHFFVNHWPSRSGGQAESEPARILAAQLLLSEIEGVRKTDPKAKVICMGDFNDHPTDKSIATVLGATGALGSPLFNYMFDDQLRGEGTHWYKGEWGSLDQFVATNALVSAQKGWCAAAESAEIVRKDYLFFADKEGAKRPSRSYAGDAYKGGYSDHLPISITLSRR